MGQGASSERQPQGGPAPSASHATQSYEALGDGRRSEAQEQECLLRPREERRRSGLRNSVGGLSRLASARSWQHEDSSTYRRETRARSTLIGPNSGAEGGDTRSRDDVVLEQEERPLIMRDMERLNDAPITDIRAAPMPRRVSVLSRLSSRVITRGQRPTDVNRATRESEERLTGNAASADLPSTQRLPQAPRSRRNRLSMFELSTTPPISAQTDAPRRNSLSAATIAAASEIPSGLEVSNPEDMPRSSRPHPRQQEASTWVRPNRGGRLRRTLLGPLEELINRNQARPQRSRNASYNTPQTGSDETRNLISPQVTGTTLIDPQGSSAHLHAADEGTEANPVELDSPDRPRSWLPRFRDAGNDANSIRDDSSIQHVLGGRSSRLIRREDDTPLSRVLQLAAAAIARQLSGANDQDPGLQSVGDDHFDGNLNDFIRTLNNAAEQSSNNDSNSTASLPPLNFWRVFRFVNHNHASSGLNQHPPTVPPDSAQNGRLVTLVVVGVRSVPSSSVLSETAGTLNTNLDDLMALPRGPADGPGLGQGLQSQPTSTRNRLQRRRTSITGNNPFPSQYESQRHQGTSTSRLNRTAGLNPLRRTAAGTSSASNQGRPPSPFPTAEAAPSDRAAFQHNSRHGSGEPSSSSTLRQRRRNGSHGDFGSGSSRRNGVVEPQDINPSEPTSNNGRHWLIYVVGTNLSEDHPAFQAPSLFTDNPSYEDMVMLSTLLGPVKPPVATAEEVAAALGVYRLEVRRADGSWMARILDRQSNAGHGVPSPVQVLGVDLVKCLVCQEDFDAGDEVRQLSICRHVFHKLCVDQWLTTGRNSCPTCRTTGVADTTAVE